MTKMRLLVVDDDALLRRSLNLQLTRAGYEVHEAEDGEVAWEMMERIGYRFVITDWNMPGLSGPELVGRMRQMLAAGYTYILMLTAHSEKMDVIAGLQAGADDYLTKPFDTDELRARVGIGVRILELEARLQESLASAAELAVRDGLTNLFNRRAFDDRLADEVQRAGRYQRPLTLLMIDIDHFKHYNDQHGHPQGRCAAARAEHAVPELCAQHRFRGPLWRRRVRGDPARDQPRQRPGGRHHHPGARGRARVFVSRNPAGRRPDGEHWRVGHRRWAARCRTPVVDRRPGPVPGQGRRAQPGDGALMHVLFVHKNFPAQFGHIAAYLIKQKGYRCTFVSETPPGMVGGIQKIQYHPAGGANEKTHYLTRTFENATAHAAGVYEALKTQVTRLRPDLIVGHSGFGSTLFLPELFPAAPMINYFEYFYHPHNSDMDFRPEWPVLEEDVLRARTRNAMILLDMEYCRAGYSPTEYQASLMPAAYRPKLRVIHDGIDTDFWRRRQPAERSFGPYTFRPDTRIVTYVSRGFESMRGFDIFMRAAKKIYTADPRVVFLIVGTDRVCYGGDLKFIPDKSFKDFILRQDDFDMKRLLFLGPAEAGRPGAGVEPERSALLPDRAVRAELVAARRAGLRLHGAGLRHGAGARVHTPRPDRAAAKFFDVDGFVATALQVLKDPEAYRHLGQAGEQLIREHYSLHTLIPRMTAFYEEVANAVIGTALVSGCQRWPGRGGLPKKRRGGAQLFFGDTWATLTAAALSSDSVARPGRG